MNRVAAIAVALCVAGCVAQPQAARLYTNQYGTFYSPVDAACAHLYGAEAKTALGAQWESELSACQMNANALQHRAVMQQYSAGQNAGIAGAMRAVGADLMADGVVGTPPPPPPVPAHPRHTTCTVRNNRVDCTSH